MNYQKLRVRNMLTEENSLKEYSNLISKVKLSDREISILNMKYVRGFKLWEIAQELGLAENTVKKIHTNILKKISKVILKG